MPTSLRRRWAGAGERQDGLPVAGSSVGNAVGVDIGHRFSSAGGIPCAAGYLQEDGGERLQTTRAHVH